MKRLLPILFLAGVYLAVPAFGKQRFPPPDFESGYKQPLLEFQKESDYADTVRDAALLLIALPVVAWFLHYKRSRSAVFAVGLLCLFFFGFYKQGCICPIGSIQNVVYAICYNGYTVPIPVLVVFFAPLVFALIFGRVFCGGVCPLGAIQDIFLFRPIKVSGRWAGSFGLLRYVYLGLAVFFVIQYERFIICEYDPFVAFFRFSGAYWKILLGFAFLGSAMFVGRVYCRFVCPYGALLSILSPWTGVGVKITPDKCIKCTLCDDACPFDAIRRPGKEKGATTATKARLAFTTVILSAVLGTAFYYVTGRTYAGLGLGIWFGIVVGAGMLGTTKGWTREEYETDNSGCFSCGRCYKYCPIDRKKRAEAGEAKVETVSEQVE